MTRKIHTGLTHLFAGLLVVQFFLAGLGAFSRGEVAEKLKLTDEQQEKLKSIGTEARKTMRAIDLGVELGAEVYVFWGGREGTETDACRRARRGPLPAGWPRLSRRGRTWSESRKC